MCCDLSQRLDLEDLFDEDGGFFDAYKKSVICRRIVQNNSLLEKLRRDPRKTGKRQSTDWFERDFKGLLNAGIVTNFRVSRAAFS